MSNIVGPKKATEPIINVWCDACRNLIRDPDITEYFCVNEYDFTCISYGHRKAPSKWSPDDEMCEYIWDKIGGETDE